MTDMSDEALIAKYLDLRGALEKMAKAYSDHVAPYQKGMEAIEGMLLGRLIERQANNTKTDSGVAYKQTNTSTKVVDKAAMLRFAYDNFGTWGKDMLTAHVAKDTVQLYMDKNEGRTPPGVEVTHFIKLVVRKD